MLSESRSYTFIFTKDSYRDSFYYLFYSSSSSVRGVPYFRLLLAFNKSFATLYSYWVILNHFSWDSIRVFWIEPENYLKSFYKFWYLFLEFSMKLNKLTFYSSSSFTLSFNSVVSSLYFSVRSLCPLDIISYPFWSSRELFVRWLLLFYSKIGCGLFIIES